MRWMFYALIAGLLEVGVIVPIVVRAHAIAGHGDCWTELEGGEGHVSIVLDSGAACKRHGTRPNGFEGKDPSRGIR